MTPAPIVSAGPALGASLVHAVVGLGIVLGLIAVFAWVLRRVSGLRTARGSASLQAEAGLQVGAKERILLVRAGEIHLLIGVAPGRVQTLHVFRNPPGGVAEDAPAPPAFGDALKKVIRGERP